MFKIQMQNAFLAVCCVPLRLCGELLSVSNTPMMRCSLRSKLKCFSKTTGFKKIHRKDAKDATDHFQFL